MINIFKKEKNSIKGAIIGAITGDSIGSYFEVIDKTLTNNTYSKFSKIDVNKTGNWTDDSSMILCTMESLIKNKSFVINDIADNYIKWLYYGKWTPYGVVLDCGRTTANALRLYRTKGYLNGMDGDDHCGNGSLMRLAPLIFYINKNNINKFDTIRKFSSITHSNIVCHIACSIYVEFALNLLNGMNKTDSYNLMKNVILKEYSNYQFALKKFDRILKDNIDDEPITSIKGSGYVIDTLETALYSFLTTKNYKESIKKAISIGDDTDTTACVTGCLSGLYYGYDSIPRKWINKLCRKDDILNLVSEYERIFK